MMKLFISEDQHITEINFNANDMESLCDKYIMGTK